MKSADALADAVLLHIHDDCRTAEKWRDCPVHHPMDSWRPREWVCSVWRICKAFSEYKREA